MEQARRKEMIAAYKQRKVEGGVYEVRCTENGKCMVRSDSDWKGAKNRFEFSQSTGSCFMGVMQEDWKRYGSVAFTFRVLETLEKGEDQTDRAFTEDLAALADLLRERYSPEILYK